MTLTAGPSSIDITDVRRRHPIEDVVAAAGIELRRTGRGYMGCCPFHDDTTASLSVAGVPDRFHCFGCGASGDVIDFVGRLHGLAFRDAVAHLDGRPATGMPLSPARTQRPLPVSAGSSAAPALDPARGYEINALAWQWFSRPVPHAYAISYLRHRRGIDLRDAETTTGQTLVGHTGNGWTYLVEHLRERGVTADELVAMDLAQHTRHGRLIDTLRDRLVTPIRLRDGRIAGFVGRDTGGHPAAPKYRNPTHTPTYDKATSLYLPLQVDGSPGGVTIVVEGALDALAITAAAAQTGQLNRYAPCSTLGVSVTPTQARQTIAAGPEQIVIALDGDQAGTDGTLRWVEALCVTNEHPASVARLPNGTDPADWLASHGPDALDTFDPAQRHTPDPEGRESVRPRQPGRELVALACAHGGEPVRPVTGAVVRLAPRLSAPALDELITGAVADMTRRGWNPGDSYARALHQAARPRTTRARRTPTPASNQGPAPRRRELH
jgi:DNA primase